MWHPSLRIILLGWVCYQGIMATRRHNKDLSKQYNSADLSVDLVQVPYIGEDGRPHVSHQPKTFPARRQYDPRTRKIMKKPKPESEVQKTREILEWMQKRHEAEPCRPKQQPSVFRRDSMNGTTEESICFIAKIFVSLGGALLGHFEELAMGQLPEASQKTEFALLIRQYSTAEYIMHGLMHRLQGHNQTSNLLVLQELNHWLKGLLRSFLRTSIGDGYADLIAAKDLRVPVQLPGPKLVAHYVQQTLQACLVHITDTAAGSKDIGVLLSLQVILKAGLPQSTSQNILYYIGTLVTSVCNHIVSRAAAIRPALESRHAHLMVKVC
jgi:hypothetical protein